MKYEWDNEKERKNIRKHGISFKEAVAVFNDPNILVREDAYQFEERWNAIGIVGSVLFVVYTERKEDIIRIISARKATKGEINEYCKNDRR